MTVTTHAGMTGTLATPAEVGAKYIRWGLGLFVFGLVIGFVPLAHYMHGSFEHGGRGIPQERHAVVGLCVDAGGLCRAARQPGHDRYRSLLCRPCAGRCNDVGHGSSNAWRRRCAQAGSLRSLWPDLPATTPSLAVWPNFYYAPVRHGICGLARTASRLHRDLHRRRHVRTRRHQTRAACADRFSSPVCSVAITRSEVGLVHSTATTCVRGRHTPVRTRFGSGALPPTTAFCL